MEYFVFDANGNQYGPARIDEINAWVREGRIDASMHVMQVGTTYRFSITQLVGIQMTEPILSSPVQPMGGQFQPGYTQAPTAGGQVQYPRAVNHAPVDNHLIKAILATLCCCLPVGVVAIVFAAQVDGHVRRGDYVAAQNTAATADTWANWSIGLGLVGICLNGGINVLPMLMQ